MIRDGANYYCFKGVAAAGNIGYSTSHLIDRQLPQISFDTSQTNKVILQVEDVSGLSTQWPISSLTILGKVLLLPPRTKLCDETAFEEADQINEGSEVTNPENDTQYCFRVEDEEGETHYINAYVTAESFEGFNPADVAGGRSESALGDSDSKAMPIITAVSVVVLLAAGVIVFSIIKQRGSMQKFK